MFRGRSLAVQETDRFTKTGRECIPAGSGAASLLLTVLVNLSVSCAKPVHMALGVAEIGIAIGLRYVGRTAFPVRAVLGHQSDFCAHTLRGVGLCTLVCEWRHAVAQTALTGRAVTIGGDFSSVRCIRYQKEPRTIAKPTPDLCRRSTGRPATHIVIVGYRPVGFPEHREAACDRRRCAFHSRSENRRPHLGFLHVAKGALS